MNRSKLILALRFALVAWLITLVAMYKFNKAVERAYEAGVNDTIERLIPGNSIPCEPWGDEQ